MPFDPVLFCLVYLAIGSLVWAFIYSAGGFADLPRPVVIGASIGLILGWVVAAYGMAMGWVRLRRVYRVQARRVVMVREVRP